MVMPRLVQPELLDTLSPADPRARRSRRDLQRINRAMANLTVMQRAIDAATFPIPPRKLLEIGAGDGTMLLRIAQTHAAQWPGVRVTLLDRQNLVHAATLKSLHELGWVPEVVTAEVTDWVGSQPHGVQWDLVLANLFLHHFHAQQLSTLLSGMASRCRGFIGCEPRRAVFPLLGSHLVGLLGANAVTREDAVLSVHAGFRDQELSTLWPDHRLWKLREYSAGLFSHCFVATRIAMS